MVGEDLRRVHVVDVIALKLVFLAFVGPEGVETGQEGFANFIGDFQHVQMFVALPDEQRAGFEVTRGHGHFLQQNAVGVLVHGIVKAQVNAREGHTQIHIQRFTHLQ